MEKLKLEKKKNLNKLNQHKESVISEIINSDYDQITNTIQEESKYTLWQRITKTLGIS